MQNLVSFYLSNPFLLTLEVAILDNTQKCLLHHQPN